MFGIKYKEFIKNINRIVEEVQAAEKYARECRRKP